MKEKIICFTMLLMMILTSCGKSDEPSDGLHEGSPRDWTYGKNQVEFYINGLEQTSVYEVTVVSKQLDPTGVSSSFPLYDVTLKVKGLLSGNKVFKINVDADVDRFEGTTVYNGKEYDVTGNYTGTPFGHHDDMGIIIRLEEK